MATSKKQLADARAKAAAMRREAAVKQRRRNLLTGGITGGVIVVLVVVLVIVSLSGKSATISDANQIVPAAASGSTTVQLAPTVATNPTTISGVLAWDTQGWPGDGLSHPGALAHDHVTGPVQYAVTPPVGGPHNPIWMNAGVYTKAIPAERAVHNLEHGAVWITYDPNLPAAQIKALQDFVGKQTLIPETVTGIPNDENRYVDLSPWATNTLPTPIVISSWGYQLRVTSPTDPRLQQFVDTFRHNKKYAPEYGSAVDGIPVQTGGVPAMYGGTQPNPAGSAQ